MQYLISVENYVHLLILRNRSISNGMKLKGVIKAGSLSEPVDSFPGKSELLARLVSVVLLF